MPDTGIDTSFYPKPQAGGIGSMSLGELLNVAKGAQELGSNVAIGDIIRKNIDPETGDFNSAGAANALSQPGPQSYGAAKHLSDIIALQRAQQEKNAQGAAFLSQGLAAAISNPTDTNVDRAFMMARNVMGPSANYNALRKQYDSLTSPAAKKSFLADMANQVQGITGVVPSIESKTESGRPMLTSPATAARRAAGAPSAEDIEPQAGAGPQVGGKPVEANRPAAGFGGMVTGPEAGTTETQNLLAQSGGKAAVGLRESADSSMTRKAMLGNLEDALTKFTAGPGADWSRVGKAFVNRNLPLPKGWQFDPESIANQEEFVKQAGQLAQSQFAALGGTGTDAKFSSAFETNPNEALSQIGNQKIIRLLKGNEDAIRAKFKAWQGYRKVHGPASYDDFAEDWNNAFDPRTFQFKYMTKDERQKYINNMDARDRNDFVSALTNAHKRGWLGAE